MDDAWRRLMWNLATSAVTDLYQPGLVQCSADGVANGVQVGYGYGPLTGGQEHALVWFGSAASMIDLHQFLPAGWTVSDARGVDASGDIVGDAFDASGFDHAIEWVPAVPEPSSIGLVGLFTLPILIRRVRKRGN